MTATASPEVPREKSGLPNSENGHRDDRTSTKQPEIVDLTADNESDVEEDVETPRIDPQKPHPVPETREAHSNANGSRTEPEHHDEERPAKRRRVRESTPTSAPRLKPESPPWKRIEAEGPSSFTENGLRKSGRINTVPLELQRGDRRITRRSFHSQASPISKNKYASTNGHATTPSGTTPQAPAPIGKSTSQKPKASKPPVAPKQQSPRKHLAREAKSSPQTRRRSSPSRPQKVESVSPKATTATRRSSRVVRETPRAAAACEAQVGSATRTTPRIKLRLRQPLTAVPLVHPLQAKVRPKLGPTFAEYFQRAGDILVEDGGMLVSDEGPRYTVEMARSDAKTILRVEDEAQPGGLLTEERCSVFQPDAAGEPPRQWAHRDHLVKAMSNFRRLMLMEQQRHRAAAKRLAEACRAEWRRKNPQPKTAEELEEEARRLWDNRYRTVVKALVGTWENVRSEINRRRLDEWEAEEQRRVKAALNEAVNISEQKLQARQAHLDSEGFTDDMEDDDEADSELDDLDSDRGPALYEDEDEDDDEDESNMSSSDEDEDKSSVLSDEGLTQEQLRQKYANIPELAKPSRDDEAMTSDGAVNSDRGGDLDDTSDESIDMDDDLGSSEMDSDDDRADDGASDGDVEDSDDEPSGLLGLFFGKSELQKIKNKATHEAESSVVEDIDMVDALPFEQQEDGDDREDEADQFRISDEPDSHVNGEAVASASVSVSVGEKSPLALNKVLSLNTGQSRDDTNRDSKEQESNRPTETGLTAANVSSGEAAGVGIYVIGSEGVDSAAQNQTRDTSTVDPPVPADRPPAPEPEIVEPHADPKQTSPETDGITNVPSPSRSQSPRTSDTKPSEVDTASSVELLSAQKPDSRSTSPQPPSAPKTEIPFLLRGVLREYQHYGLDWLAGLYANNTNGILADEMGLGKTIQTIALLAHLACYHEVWGPHLVIVPTSVMLNWEMEFKKWCPGFKILTYYGNQDERKKKRHGWTNDDVWNVCITSYQMVLQDQQVFKRRRWHYMILDEAHNIKNFKSQRWQTLLGFNTHSRLLLTGTPLQNNLTELWSLLFFLMPPENGQGGFADLQEFHDWFHKPESQILESGREQMDDEARAIIAKLHKVLRPYLLRRLKADVEKQMPAKYEHVEFCRLSKRQRELYDGFLARTDTRQTLSSGNYLSIINCLMQLRKVCNHPDLFVDRPIMTSFRMQKSVPAEYEMTEQVVRHSLLAVPPMSTVCLGFLNLVPTQHEGISSTIASCISKLSSHRMFMDLREAQKTRAQNAYTNLDPATVQSNVVYLESAARWGRFEELQHCVYLNALRRQQRPIYGQNLRDFLTLSTDMRPFKPRPQIPKKIMSWFEEDSFLLRTLVPTLEQRASSMEMTITKFSCVTPAVVTRDMNQIILGRKGVESFEEWNLKLCAPVKYAPYMPKESPPDPWHEARMRLSIQFPDKRLLQYDCGKLQVLDKLLRKLQTGGHRALIFTQMTKVLDILEQFLNIHGHKYLRLDGATKVEQRQILTDRFNHDPRILCFILSTRSGGLGINLTGADTVIFYDQDWNPAMDKQCQDRCHRIGQTRDVHIYRLVSEHTIEANILRKASQKQMLDDVVIQEGEFTTDYFNKLTVRDVIGDAVSSDGASAVNDGDAAANAAMDRVLGGVENAADQRNAGRVLEQAEDTEDVAAARVAEKEILQDDADFSERPTPGGGASSAGLGTPREGSTAPGTGVGSRGKTPGPSALGLFVESAGGDPAGNGVEVETDEIEYNAWGQRMGTVDDHMLAFMAEALKGTPLELPKDRKKSKRKGKDMRKR